VSFAERQLKDLTAKYPNDTLYPAILTYRQLDKIAGTYIGRPA
jgi:DNA polymerase I-like protein with 3'-5' exonuclease and polymerase domains